MNQEPSYAKLLDTVREAGGDVETMTAFADLVAAAEREACAKLIEATSLNGLKDNPAMQSWIAEMLFAYVKAIRARGDTK